jgi:hypothetical protein
MESYMPLLIDVLRGTAITQTFIGVGVIAIGIAIIAELHRTNKSLRRYLEGKKVEGE